MSLPLAHPLSRGWLRPGSRRFQQAVSSSGRNQGLIAEWGKLVMYLHYEVPILPSNPAVTLEVVSKVRADTPNAAPSHPATSRHDHLIHASWFSFASSQARWRSVQKHSAEALVLRFLNVSLSTIALGGVCQLTRACALPGRTGGCAGCF